MSTSKPLQIFKAGRHTAMSGAVLDFSAADLAACARAYDPAKHEAPIVVGHPRHDAPAYGWVGSLSAGNGLEASPRQVDPAFAEMVAKGAFKKISASFYGPDSPQNPVPGVYYLRHVGFLGAQPPAVKGLRAPEFADAEVGVVEFADWSDVQNAALWRRLRDFFIDQFGLDKADSVIPDYAVGSLEDDARQESPDETVDPNAGPSAAYTEQSNHQEKRVTPEQKAALEAENVQLKQQVAESSAREKAARAAAQHAEHASFCEGLVKSGQLAPGIAPMMAAALDTITAGAVVEFGEGDAKKPLATALMEALKASPKIIEFSEISRDKETAAAGHVSFAAPEGYSVDPAQLELHRRALAYADANKVDFTVAVAACVRQ